MPLPKISEARELTDEQLATEIIAVKKQLFSLRLQKATRQLDKPHQIKHAKHRLGQLLTVERERQVANTNAAEPATEE
ncbi:50S ribosomal protein L29 [Scytonema millei]|uniref:Large ribosomal subunit protein uL29 n=1 Tax=Scytonema millei VB511283 TaxID=1245923 RepID=A0A9X5E0H0_9CYAN|nr:50S ribosomal protein L29 [Scytonema millei]NHC33262.1 50S ribosomal protein L29 [Scytonema millei VB511283]